MLIRNKGIIIFSKLYKDNDLFIKLLSNSDEIISGIVYGGLSKKKRNIFQKGFYLNFEISIISNKPNSISGELIKPYMSNIIDNKYKVNCLLSVVSLINLSLIEGQSVKNIFNVVDEFINKMFETKKWFSDYCIFLFQLLKLIGYEINFLDNVDKIYFDLKTFKFTKFKSKNSVEFPFKLLENNNYKTNKVDVQNIFKIFELVFVKYHLTNFNLQLPNQYHLFKKLILKELKYE